MCCCWISDVTMESCEHHKLHSSPFSSTVFKWKKKSQKDFSKSVQPKSKSIHRAASCFCKITISYILHCKKKAIICVVKEWKLDTFKDNILISLQDNFAHCVSLCAVNRRLVNDIYCVCNYFAYACVFHTTMTGLCACVLCPSFTVVWGHS